MKKLILFLHFFGIFSVCCAQPPSYGCDIRYTYDVTGNRIKREWYCWTQASQKEPQNQMDDSLSDTMIVAVYPNPSTGVYYVRIKKEIRVISAIVRDIFDNVVLQTEFNNFQNELNLRSLPAGIYFLNLIDKHSNSWAIKLVKL